MLTMEPAINLPSASKPRRSFLSFRALRRLSTGKKQKNSTLALKIEELEKYGAVPALLFNHQEQVKVTGILIQSTEVRTQKDKADRDAMWVMWEKYRFEVECLAMTLAIQASDPYKESLLADIRAAEETLDVSKSRGKRLSIRTLANISAEMKAKTTEVQQIAERERSVVRAIETEADQLLQTLQYDIAIRNRYYIVVSLVDL
jgi:hypothetical protein